MDTIHWIVQATILTVAIYSEIIAVRGAKTDDNTGSLVAGLSDSPDGEWESCNIREDCAMKKIAPCAISGMPRTCKMTVWKEEIFGCHACNGEWLAIPPAKWTECNGTDCEDMTQHFSYACSNSGVNPNCKLVRTRFCDTNSTCYGTWSEWFVNAQECLKQCRETGFMTRKRTCLHEGNESSSCHEKAVGNQNAPVMIQNAFISCTNKSCPTSEHTELTAWSQWMTCNARCSLPTGKQIRYKECVYKDGKDAPMSKCAGKQPFKEERLCFYNVSKCESKITATAKSDNTTPLHKIEEAVTTASQSDRQRMEKRLKAFPTQANGTRSSTDKAIGEKQEETEKQQYQIAIVLVAVISCLIILAVLIFLCCRKKHKKKRSNKRLKKRISIVALQAHSGLSDGGEFERLRKSTVTSQDHNALFSQTGHESLANFRLQGKSAIGVSPSRRLPKVPKEYISEDNVNDVPSHHVYEEMGLQRSKDAEDWLQNKAASRSSAQTLATSRHRDRASQWNNKKIAPPKPPRKSMLLLEVADASDSEVRDIPKSLYESKPSVKNELAAHRVSSTGSDRFLSLRERRYDGAAAASRSAPVSPYQRNMAQTNNSSGVIIPVREGLHWVMPARQNTGVIYVPCSPIHSEAIARTLSNGPNTPLHAIPQTSLRHTKSYRPTPRPRTMGSVPRISVADADDYNQHSVMHMFQTTSPTLNAYAEMRGVAGDFDFSGLPGSFIHLHGTHNITPNKGTRATDFSVETLDTNIELSDNIEIEEDANGYLVPNSPRRQAIWEYIA